MKGSCMGCQRPSNGKMLYIMIQMTQKSATIQSMNCG